MGSVGQYKRNMASKISVQYIGDVSSEIHEVDIGLAVKKARLVRQLRCTWQGVAWHDVAWHDVAWQGVAWHGVV